MQDGRPWQRINPAPRFELAIEDLRDLEPDRRQSVLAERIRQEADRPFDLERDLALRASLLQPADDEHVLLVTMHHIASDGWSMTVFWRELAATVRQAQVRRAGDPAGIADPLRRLRGLAAKDRSRGSRPGSAGLVLASARLDGLPPLELPTDRPRPLEPRTGVRPTNSFCRPSS